MVLTGLDLVLERLRAVHNQLLETHGTVRDLELEQFLHVLRVVELEHLLVAVIRVFDKVQQDIDDFQQELFGLGARCHICGQEICVEEKKATENSILDKVLRKVSFPSSCLSVLYIP